MMGVAKKFFALMCLLLFAIVSYKLLTSSTHKPPSVSQAEFVQALNAGKIQSVSIFMGYTLADFKYAGRDVSSGYVTDIPIKELPSLIKKMIDSGTVVEFASVRKMDNAEFVLDNLPLVLLILAVGYIFLIQRRKRA